MPQQHPGSHIRPVLLVIFDGFGLNPNRAYNGWAQARTPHLDHYFASFPHTALQASGAAVGLPDGQFGNSEVGHLTLGSGRILLQDLVRISASLADGSFGQIPAWKQVLRGATRLHLVGMVSDGGVHSHIDHLLAILPLVVDAGVEPIVHMITDGRDTAPQCADQYAARVDTLLKRLGRGRIATLCGRYTAMDRAGHFERTRLAWQALVKGEGRVAGNDVQSAIHEAWLRGETDEFIQPTILGDPAQDRIRKEDTVFFFNFRSDRMRQLTEAVGMPEFKGFDRGTESARRTLCMTSYNNAYSFPALFAPEIPGQVLAQVISAAGLRQFHCAETEKYAHVTYFFNGGREEPFPGEDRAIIPSPVVATYDLQPQMSAPQVADRIITAMKSGLYHFILCNFANSDMVGHTANIPAIIQAVESLDLQFHRLAQVACETGFQVLLTADHGNCDEMVDPVSGKPHTQHTVYPVPLLYLGTTKVALGIGRGLADVAPTILHLMDIQKPADMTGHSILLVPEHTDHSR